MRILLLSEDRRISTWTHSFLAQPELALRPSEIRSPGPAESAAPEDLNDRVATGVSGNHTYRIFDTEANLPSGPTTSPRPTAAASKETRLEPRFVNVRVLRPEDTIALPRTSSFQRGKTYLLRLDIGPFAVDSIVENAGGNPFPADLLPSTMSDDGYWLDVIVSSDGFSFQRVQWNLYLPKVGVSWACACKPFGFHQCSAWQRSPFLDIPFRAPETAGACHMRIGIYFRNNLVQSQLLTAEITATESSGVGHTSRIDYTLSADLSQLDFLTPRTAHIMTNDNANSSHGVVISGGTEDAIAFNLSDGQIRGAIDAIRATLRGIHIEEKVGNWGGPGLLKNRYDQHNAKSTADLIADLKLLAPLGWLLWTSFLVDKPDERRTLQQSGLREPGLIQVSRIGGSGFVFPWALIYDIPLESDVGAHTPCRILEQWETLPAVVDPSHPQCPFVSTHAKNTICPFGFWGFRHIIEQPPSMPRGRSLPVEIKCHTKPEVVIGISLELDPELTRAHIAAVGRNLGGFHAKDLDSRRAIADALGETELEVVYLYCHGRRQSLPGNGTPVPYLGVGDKESISPMDITTWDVADWSDKPDHWRKTSPLVFINGCHTAELTPELLINFVDAFAGVYAAGVIGTEVTLHQQVASEAAERFFATFQNGASTGAALRSVRLAFLCKGNLMGLAYTPYCSADLKLSRANNL